MINYLDRSECVVIDETVEEQFFRLKELLYYNSPIDSELVDDADEVYLDALFHQGEWGDYIYSSVNYGYYDQLMKYTWENLNGIPEEEAM